MDGQEAGTGATGPTPTAAVIRDEFGRLWPEAEPPQDPAAYARVVHDLGQGALCLSGGGARSSAFSIGLLQALSRKGLLTRFHYLSSVGGGAGAAGWLHRWIADEAGGASVVMAQMARSGGSQVEALFPQSGRRLIHKRGVYFDPWGKAAVHLRNQIVNWLTLAPLLMSLALVPSWLLSWVTGAAEGVDNALLRDLSLATAAVALAVSIFFAFRYHPTYGYHSAAFATGDGLTRRPLLPLILWLAFGLLVLCADSPLSGVRISNHWLLALSPPLATIAAIALCLLIPRRPGKAKLLADLPAWFVAALMAGAVIGVSWEAIRRYPPDPFAFLLEAVGWVGSFTGAFDLKGGSPAAAPAPHEALAVLVLVGPFVLLMALIVGITCFLALRRRSHPSPHADNAWMTLLSSYLLRIMIVWAVVGGTVLLIASGARRYVDLDVPLLTTLGAVALFLIFFASKEADALGGIGSFLVKLVPLRLVSVLATVLFLLVLLLLASAAAEAFAEAIRTVMQHYLGIPFAPEAARQAAMSVLVVIAAIQVLVPSNRFSLHAVRRNQLTNWFLAAARETRDPDQLTGYDPDDDFPLSRLRAASADGAEMLYPIFNAAFITRGGCAAPFSFAPAYIGSAALEQPPDPADGGFVSTCLYSGGGTDRARIGSGITLAEAMAAAGAGGDGRRPDEAGGRAVVATLLGLRRSFLLANPAKVAAKDWNGRWVGRRIPLIDLVRELLGASSELGGQIEIHHGARFDNLGLYEALRRRCRYVLVSDATLDPDRSFADLAAVVRNARTGLNVSIAFDELQTVGETATGASRPPWAIGRILYPEGTEGRIVYLKAALPSEGAPIEIASYARCSKDFPHESTADEAITDSQFESYRGLGEHLGAQLPSGEEPTLASLFDAALEQQSRGAHEGARTG